MSRFNSALLPADVEAMAVDLGDSMCVCCGLCGCCTCWWPLEGPATGDGVATGTGVDDEVPAAGFDPLEWMALLYVGLPSSK